MKELYQTLKHVIKIRPFAKPQLVMLKCPDFLINLALDETRPVAEKHLCFMDNYQLKEMDLLKKIGINFTQITTTNDNY